MKNCCSKNCPVSNPQPLHCFGKNKRQLDGLQLVCRVCHSRSVQDWEKKNPDKAKQLHARANSKWKKANPGKWNAIAAKYRAAKMKRTPPWLTESHYVEIRDFYEKAQNLTKELGIPMAVDHIIPLQGENVSGLHVPWNLRVVTKSENCSKRNKIRI